MALDTWSLPAELHELHVGDPISHDDLLDFHHLLADDASLAETIAQTSRLVADLQDEIMTSRMVPVWQVFDRFPRVADGVVRIR